MAAWLPAWLPACLAACLPAWLADLPAAVKCIPGSSPDASTFVDGVVVRHNTAGKAMARSLARPRILLLAGAVEYQPPNRLAVVDNVLEQVVSPTDRPTDRTNERTNNRPAGRPAGPAADWPGIRPSRWL
jgi:hypothetical protein